MGQGTSKLNEIEKTQGGDKDIKLSDKSETLKDENVATGDEIGSSPSEIRSQIENTRNQMGETIDEIQERLSVAHITEQVKEEVSGQISDAWKSTKETVFDAAIKTTGEVMKYIERGLDEISDTAVGRTARNNPLAFTLIGAGIGILAYNAYQNRSVINDKRRMLPPAEGRGRNFRSDNDRSSLQYAKKKAGNAYDSATDTVENAYETATDTAGNIYKKTTDAAGNVLETVTDVAGNVYDATSEAAKSIYNKTGNAVSGAYDTAGKVGSQVIDTAQELGHKAQNSYDYYIDENPLAVGALALAIGAAVGMSIPATKIESNLMGDARDNLMEQAGQKVGNLIDTAQDTVKEKIDQVKTIADDTAQTAVEETKKAADKTVQKAKDEAKKKDFA
jgi:ElaB/YqjD/DUF883 family membrane-anchored ribosome-binding protein